MIRSPINFAGSFVGGPIEVTPSALLPNRDPTLRDRSLARTRPTPVGMIDFMDAPPWSQVILGGQYNLVEMIGFGGSAQVWRSFDRELHREVAVKILATHSSDEPSVFQRFRREALAIWPPFRTRTSSLSTTSGLLTGGPSW